MQNNKQHTDFIRRLKQRPKQGGGILDDMNAAYEVFKNFSGVASDVATKLTANITTLGDSLASTFGESAKILEEVQKGFEDSANASGNYLAGLNKNLAVNRELIKIQTESAKATLVFEQRNAKLNKTFGIGVEMAAKYSQVYAQHADALGITHKQAISYAGSINNIVTSVNILGKAREREYKNLLAIQNVLVTKMGLDAKSAEEFTYYAGQQGKHAAQQLKATELAAQKMDQALGTNNSFLVITEEIGKSSASTQLQFGRMGGSLELAAIKGRNLGLTLDQVSSIGNKMLNIESSIGDELEYQMLSGKRLIGDKKAANGLAGKSLTNAFREAALMGDANKQADALNAILEQEGETLTNNVMARQQMAKLLGMEENQLARALQKKKLLESMGADEKLFQLGGKEFQAAIERMRDAGQATDDQIKEAIKLRDNRTTDQLMREQVDLLEDTAASNFLQITQAEKIAKNSDYQIELLGKIAGVTKVRSQADLEDIGQTTLALGTLSQYLTTLGNIKSAKLEADEKVEDFLAINGKLVKYRKDDLVIGGTFGGNTQQVINSVSGGGGGGMGMSPEQFAAAIVTSMKNHGKFEVTISDVDKLFS